MRTLSFLSSVAFAAPVETGKGIAISADPIAEMAGNLPDDISEFVAGIVEKKEDVSLGAFDLYVRLSKECPDEFETWPVVGSSWKDEGERRTNNPETFQAWDQEKQRNVERNWFTIMTADTAVGKRWSDRIDNIRKASKPETQNEASEEYRAMSHDGNYLKDELAKYTQRMSAARSLFRNATRIRDVLNLLGNYSEAIVVKFNTYVDGNGDVKMKRSKYPFRLCNASDHSTFKPLSTGDLLKFNPEKVALAVANGGNHKAFVDAIARAATPPDGNEKKVLIGNVSELENAIAGVTNYLDMRSKEGREHESALRTLLTAKRSENESLIEQIGLLYHSLGSLYSIIEPAYNRLIDKKAAANAA